MFTSVQDPVNSAFHPPGSDPVPETADPVPMGGLLQLCGEDSTDHTGGTHTVMFIHTIQLHTYTVHGNIYILYTCI